MDSVSSAIISLMLGAFFATCLIFSMKSVVIVNGEKGSVLTVEYNDVVYKLIPLEED